MTDPHLHPAALGRILVVEDDAPLAALLGKYLRRAGYETECCSRGSDAVRRFAAEPARWLAVIIDLSLPDIGGEDVAAKLLAIHPAARLILTSGLPWNPAAAFPAGQVRFLQKPFAPAALLGLLA